MRRLLLAVLAASTLAGPMTGCFYSHADDWAYDRDHRAYRHRHWRDEEVYRREDGRWYARRRGAWIVVEDVPAD